MRVTIIERGRGPEIAGTRITVYDILQYVRAGWHHTAIAATLRLSSAEVLEAIRYIDEHEEAVNAQYEKNLARIAKGHSPEVQAKVDAAHAKFQAILQEHERRRAKGENGRPSGGR
jgi:uncharacterized protein (DUF433 family)